MFFNRFNELKSLNKRYKKGKAELVVVYGRRRIGKSALIEQFIKNKNGIRLLAREEAQTIQLRRFSERLSVFFNDDVLAKNHFTNWDAFFTYLAEKAKKRIIIALDEFPYLVNETPSLPSILQGYWDNKLEDSKIFLLLCGSSISMMEKKVLGHKSPLYGRRTGQLLLQPFKFKTVFNYLKKDLRECVGFYSVFGETPAYVIEINREKNLFENISSKVLQSDSFLFKDVEFLLRAELKEPRYYFSVLCSVAKGNTKIGKIINDTGLKKGIVGKYLSVLSDLHLIKREVPITENPLKSRRGIYKLEDNFFRFWFRFVYPHKEEIENNKQRIIIKEIKNALPRFSGKTFEKVCKQALFELEKQGKIPAFNKAGRWWYKDKEIDLIALNKKNKKILFGECKWKEKVNAARELKKLKEKTQHVKWHNEKRKEHYAIFAKTLRKKVKQKNTHCYNLKDLEKALKK